MKILLTGSHGYIGTNYRYYDNDNEIISCDYKIGYSILDFINENPKEIDAIIHLAAMPGVGKCEKNYIGAWFENVTCSYLLMKYAVDNKIPIVVTTSQAIKTPTQSVYSMTKATCENIALTFNKENVIDSKIKVIRPANVYGDTENLHQRNKNLRSELRENYIHNKSSVIAKFMVDYIRGEPLKVVGDGTQTRDFIHIEDICKAIKLYIESENTAISPMDLGTGGEHSIKEIADEFTKNYQFVEGDPGASGNKADTSIIESMLGFIPQVRVVNFIKDFKRNSQDYI